MFQFLEVGKLTDDDLELRLVEKVPANDERGFVPFYRFAMKVGEQTVGEIKLRIGDTPDLRMFSGQIGYNVSSAFRGHRYASRSCRLLFDLARRHGMTELWITCYPENTASRKTCEQAGAAFVEIVELPEYHDLYQRGELHRNKARKPPVFSGG